MANNKITILIESILNPNGFGDAAKATTKLQKDIKNTERSVYMSNLGMMFGFKMVSMTINNFFRDALTTYNELTNFSGALGMATIGLEANFKLLQVELISAFGPTLAIIINWLADLALWISSIDPAILNIVVGALVAIGTITRIAATVASLDLLAGSINAMILGKDSLSKLKDTLTELGGVQLTSLKDVIKEIPGKFTAAFDTLKETIFSGTWWSGKWDGFKTATKSVWEGLFGAGGTIPTLIDKGKEAFAGLVTKIQQLSPLAQLAIIGGIGFAVGSIIGLFVKANTTWYDVVQFFIASAGVMAILMAFIPGMQAAALSLGIGVAAAEIGLLAIAGTREDVMKRQQEAELPMIEQRAITALTTPGMQANESGYTELNTGGAYGQNQNASYANQSPVTYNTYSEGAITITVPEGSSLEEIQRIIRQTIYGSESG